MEADMIIQKAKYIAEMFAKKCADGRARSIETKNDLADLLTMIRIYEEEREEK